jgi:SHS family lactate transporter-like MFS transporter
VLGIVPIFLSEISPPAFRSTFAGVAYQMGSMVSSASAQIEAGRCLSLFSDNRTVLNRFFRSLVGGENLRTTIQGPNGPENVPNYALIQGIFIGSVSAYVIVLALLGPENHGSHFERGKTAFQAGASKEDISSAPEETGGVRDVEKSSVGSGGKEKGEAQHVENVRAAKDSPL